MKQTRTITASLAGARGFRFWGAVDLKCAMRLNILLQPVWDRMNIGVSSAQKNNISYMPIP
jgi:hypothetical protein